MRSSFLAGLITALALTSGCATQLTPEEREWRRGIDAENWRLCEMVYQRQNVVIVSDHPHVRHRRHRPHEIQSDLVANQCRRVLKEYWAEY